MVPLNLNAFIDFYELQNLFEATRNNCQLSMNFSASDSMKWFFFQTSNKTLTRSSCATKCNRWSIKYSQSTTGKIFLKYAASLSTSKNISNDTSACVCWYIEIANAFELDQKSYSTKFTVGLPFMMPIYMYAQCEIFFFFLFCFVFFGDRENLTIHLHQWHIHGLFSHENKH